MKPTTVKKYDIQYQTGPKGRWNIWLENVDASFAYVGANDLKRRRRDGIHAVRVVVRTVTTQYEMIPV